MSFCEDMSNHNIALNLLDVNSVILKFSAVSKFLGDNL